MPQIPLGPMACCQTASLEPQTVHEIRESCIIQDVPAVSGQLQLMARGIEELIKAELKSVRLSQEHIERRQVKLEQVLIDWMAKVGNESSAPGQRGSGITSKKLSKDRPSADFGSRGTDNSRTPSAPTMPATFDIEVTDESKPLESALQSFPAEHQRSLPSARTSTSSAKASVPVIKRFVFHNAFDIFFSALILLNAIFIGAEIEYKTTHEQTSTLFKIVSFTFALLFTAELFMRLGAYGAARYFDRRSSLFPWNLFDCAMVIISVIEVVDTIATGGESGSGTAKSLLRLIRMARLMRILRVLRFSPQLRMMLFMIFESTKSLTYVMFLIICILYVFSIIFTMGGTEYLGVPGDATFDTRRHSQDVQNYYGTIPRSLYTCFRSMTGGQSWGEVMDPLVDISPFYASVFLFYIAFSIFTLLNIVTGVFVEAVTAKAQSDRDLVVEKELAQKRACVQNLQVLFEEADSDGSGQITMKEFVRQLQDEKVLAYLSHLSIDTSNVQELFQTLDKDGSGAIEINEFVDNLMHLMRGQTVEQYVQKLMNENRRTQHNLFKFMEFVEVEFKHIKGWVERRERWLEQHEHLSPRPESAIVDADIPNEGVKHRV